jgi:hypothetical protein
MVAGTASDPAEDHQEHRPRKWLRAGLVALAALLIAWGAPWLLTHNPASGGFIFALVVTVGGIAALASAAAGPRSRIWRVGLVFAAIAVAAIGLLLTWVLYVLIARPDFE